MGSNVASLIGNQVSWKTFITIQKLLIFANLNLENLVSFVERPLSEAICERRIINFIHSDNKVSEQ